MLWFYLPFCESAKEVKTAIHNRFGMLELEMNHGVIGIAVGVVSFSYIDGERAVDVRLGAVVVLVQDLIGQ